jgi:hypothetical protein
MIDFDPRTVIRSAVARGLVAFPTKPEPVQPDQRKLEKRLYHREYKRHWRANRRRLGVPC